MKLIATRVQEEEEEAKKRIAPTDKSFKSLSESESWGNRDSGERVDTRKVEEEEEKAAKEGNVQTKRTLKSVKEARSC